MNLMVIRIWIITVHLTINKISTYEHLRSFIQNSTDNSYHYVQLHVCCVVNECIYREVTYLTLPLCLDTESRQHEQFSCSWWQASKHFNLTFLKEKTNFNLIVNPFNLFILSLNEFGICMHCLFLKWMNIWL